MNNNTNTHLLLNSIIGKPQTDIEQFISEELRPFLAECSDSYTRGLSVMLLLFNECNGSTTDRVRSVMHRFKNVYGIITEHNISMPEELLAIEEFVTKLAEEGEGGGGDGGSPPTGDMNVTAGIEANVPRIYTRKKKKSEVAVDGVRNN